MKAGKRSRNSRCRRRLPASTFILKGKVKLLTTGEEEELKAVATFSLNHIDVTDKIEDLHLRRAGENWIIDLLGKSGEARPDRPVNLRIKHRDFCECVNTILQSDASGNIGLGKA